MAALPEEKWSGSLVGGNSTTTSTGTTNNDQQNSLIAGSLQKLLRVNSQDRILQTVRLEGGHGGRARHLSIVCNEKAGEYCLLGTDSSSCNPSICNNRDKEESCDKEIEDIEVGVLCIWYNYWVISS